MSAIVSVDIAADVHAVKWDRTALTVASEKLPSDSAPAAGMPGIAGSSASSADENRLEKLMERMNQELKNAGISLRFRYNEEAEMQYVEVIDLETMEVISTMPPEYMIELSIKMKELVGFFLDRKL